MYFKLLRYFLFSTKQMLPGGRYQSVTTSCEYVWLGTLLARASPKSASFSSPHSLISRFCGLTSRCRTRRLWQYERPRNSWKRKRRTLRWSRPPPCRSIYCERSVFLEGGGGWVVAWREIRMKAKFNEICIYFENNLRHIQRQR